MRNHATSTRRVLAGLAIACALGFAAPAAGECGWRLKEGRTPSQGGGITCRPGQMHFQTATLACEFSPLHLDLQSDCAAEDDTCHVRIRLDSAEYAFTALYFPVGQIWASFIRIPLADRYDFLDALRYSRQMTALVAGRAPWDIPTEGLRDTVTALMAQCASPTS